MNPDLERRITLIASDRESGASEILAGVMSVLRDAMDAGDDVLVVARAVCRAQPSMASIWNAALAALASARNRSVFDRFTQRVGKAPDALVRFAVECFPPAARGDAAGIPLRIVTISFSRSVTAVLERLAGLRPLHIACSESRPALEGRRLAVRMAAAGIPVTFFSDAAIAHALGAVDAVLVGADAVAPEWFLNKSGTRLLAAAAAQQSVPVYVVASRDKFMNHALAGLLRPREGDAAEIWDGAPAGVTVRNPYFESTPLDLAASVITDIGVLSAAMVPEVCESLSQELPSGLLEMLRLSK